MRLAHTLSVCHYLLGFDLRLPYADQGYVDEDADVMGKMTSFFGGGKQKKAAAVEPEPKSGKKKGGWPW